MSSPADFRRNPIASFFVGRPVFGIVVAIATILGGLLGIARLPITQYPDIAPTTVRISATYPGATAAAVESSVTEKIEGVMTGLTGLLYLESSSSSGSSSVSLTFDNSITPELAQVEVQNKLSSVVPQLPESVRQRGVDVSRRASSILMIGNIFSRDGRYSSDELADLMASRIEDRILRLDGVGGINSFGSGYAMRVWLDPYRLNQYQLLPSDIVAAIGAQNSQIAAGSIGASPAVPGQQLRATIVTQSQLTDVEEFEAIILKTESDGSTVRLGDVARVELGLESYGRSARFNGMPAAGFGVQLASGANAITTANAVHEELDSLADSLPPGVEIAYAFETTPFVEISIARVVQALIQAIVMVFLVLLLFLQNLRATLIPILAIPVALMGTFAVLAVLGYSINLLTLFAMVLSIGLLVDDAIVVIENVERLMREERLTAREATEKTMGQITGALIGTTLVLVAVVTPMALFPGSVGVIYRQFSVTIATALILSTLVAITLSPALCASMLGAPRKVRTARWLAWFNRGLERATQSYVPAVGALLRRRAAVLAGFVVVLIAVWGLYRLLPSSFVPEEDQGVLMTMITLPEGANAARTNAVVDLVEQYYLEQEQDTVDAVFVTLGFSFGSSGENTAMAFVRLRDFAERRRPDQSAAAVSARAMAHFRPIRDAQVFVLRPPAIRGLGQSGGFSMYLEDVGNRGWVALLEASNELAAAAERGGLVENVRGDTNALDSQLRVEVDQEKAGALGVDLAAANALISTAFSGRYVNDFNYEGEIKPVYVQGDAAFRMQPTDLYRWYMKNASGEMLPLSAVATVGWTQGSPSLSRLNGTPAISMQGSAASGVSSGAAMDAMEAVARELPGGFNVAWVGQSFQERLAGSQAMLLYAISLLFVFLCLAALYESWSIPFAVILVVPIGIFGALSAALLFGQSNDVYFKVGLLITMGLTARNAILIVEFAREMHDRGIGLVEAALEASRIRFRPILMTALTFIIGVAPLAFATGAGAASQHAVGIGVLGGMVAATLLGVFLAPLFFVAILDRRISRPSSPAARGRRDDR